MKNSNLSGENYASTRECLAYPRKPSTRKDFQDVYGKGDEVMYGVFEFSSSASKSLKACFASKTGSRINARERSCSWWYTWQKCFMGVICGNSEVPCILYAVKCCWGIEPRRSYILAYNDLSTDAHERGFRIPPVLYAVPQNFKLYEISFLLVGTLSVLLWKERA